MASDIQGAQEIKFSHLRERAGFTAAQEFFGISCFSAGCIPSNTPYTKYHSGGEIKTQHARKDTHERSVNCSEGVGVKDLTIDVGSLSL